MELQSLMPDIRKHFEVTDGGCYPDWNRIESLLDQWFSGSDPNQLWLSVVHEWLGVMAEAGDLEVFETRNLVVMSPFTGEAQVELAGKFENALKKTLSYLGTAAKAERIGKLAILIFPDSTAYGNYVSEFYPEDSVVPMTGGMCFAKSGYVHLALYLEEDVDLESIFVHEATHAYLSGLQIPNWMDEALAMRMEGLVAGRPPAEMDRILFRRHRAHWNAETLAQFSSGESWSIPGESFHLSYQLAEIIWSKIETTLEANWVEIQELIQTASFEDGGEEALQSLFGVGLNDLFRSFLG